MKVGADWMDRGGKEQKKKYGWLDLMFTSSLNQEAKFACWI